MDSTTVPKSSTRVSKKGIPRLIELSDKRKYTLIISGLFAALSSCFSFIPFVCVFFIIKIILNGLSMQLPIDMQKIVYYGFMAFLGISGAILANVVAAAFSHIAAFNILLDLKLKYISHISSLSLGFHSDNPSGKLRKIIDDNIEKLEGFIAHNIPDTISAVTAPFVMIALLFIMDWRYGLCSLAAILLSLFTLIRSYNLPGREDSLQQYVTSLEEMNAGAVEYVRGISVVKAFNQTIFSFKKFHESIHTYKVFVLQWTLDVKHYFVLFFTLTSNVYLFLIPLGIFLSKRGNDYNAFALSFLFYLIFAPSISPVLSKVLYLTSKLRMVGENINRLDEFLKVEPLKESDKDTIPQNHTIKFNNVHFEYNAGNEVLKGINFTANENQITALVGPSGGGKSTIGHLVARFWDIKSGSITIGGVDIRDINKEKLMNMVSFVFQDIFLFKQSISDNIRLGKPEATKEEIIKAAKAAYCHDFIEKLPDGYDTVVGTKGMHLSGGERQRLIIARAILKNSPILILDEATAFADPENEYLIQKAFEELLRYKTVIIIAHRLSTIIEADQILVVDNGSLTEKGTHTELLQIQGRYSTLWDNYSRALSWKIRPKGETNV